MKNRNAELQKFRGAEKKSAFPHFRTSAPQSAKEALRDALMRLQRAGIESASLDARVLLEHVLGISRETLLLRLEMALAPRQTSLYQALIARRLMREPVSHLTGKREFWGMEFSVTRATLDPRPDSETLVEAVLGQVDQNRAFTLLDLGTGTGCLLLALLKECKNAVGLGVDISADTLAVAQKNAIVLGLNRRATFQRSAWWETISGKFDVVISNPPYIASGEIAGLAPEVARFEPKLALDGGEDGLDCYRAILAKLPSHLTENGVAAFEIGIGQSKGFEMVAKQYGFEIIGIKQDLSGIPRCIMIQPTEGSHAQKNSHVQ